MENKIVVKGSANPAPFKKLPNEVYGLVDYVVPNEYEAEALAGVFIKDDDSAAEAVDTTSAGNCFIGTVTTKLSCGEPTTNAIAFGTRASAVAFCRQGAACSIPFAKEVEEID